MSEWRSSNREASCLPTLKPPPKFAMRNMLRIGSGAPTGACDAKARFG